MPGVGMSKSVVGKGRPGFGAVRGRPDFQWLSAEVEVRTIVVRRSCHLFVLAMDSLLTRKLTATISRALTPLAIPQLVHTEVSALSHRPGPGYFFIRL